MNYKELYKCAVKTLETYNRTFNDVVWCGSVDNTMLPKVFKEFCYGQTCHDTMHVDTIMGDDFWLELREHPEDDRAFWVFKYEGSHDAYIWGRPPSYEAPN